MDQSLEFSLVAKFIDKVTAPLDRLSAMSKESTRKFSRLHAELSDLGAQSRAIKTFEKMNGTLQSSRARLAEAREHARRLTVEYQQSDKPTRTMRRNVDVAWKSVKRLEKAQFRNMKATAEASRKMRLAGIEVRHYKRHNDQLTDSIKSTNAELRRMSELQSRADAAGRRYDSTMQRAANASLVVGGLRNLGEGIVNAIANPAGTAISIEDAMGDVDKYIANLDFSKARQEIMALSNESGLLFENIAGMVAAGGQIGLNQKEAIDFTRVGQKIAVAFDIATEDAIRDIQTISSTMNIEVAGLEAFGDSINYLGDNTKSATADITKMLARSGSVAVSAGLLPTEAVALAALVKEGSDSAEVAATGMKNLLLTLTGGEQMANSQREMLEDLGFDAGAVAVELQADAVGTIRSVLSAIAERDQAEHGGVITSLFGREATPVVAALVNNMARFDEVMALGADTLAQRGSMQREYEREMQKTTRKLQQRQQQWRNTMGQLGDTLLPIVNRFAEAITPVIGAVGAFIEKYPGLTQGIMVVVGGVGLAALALGPLIASLYALGVAASWVAKQNAVSAASMAASGVGGRFGGRGLMGGIKQFARRNAAMATLVGTAGIGSTLLNSQLSGGEKAEQVSQQVGGVGGALAGAALGSTVGSVVPVVGTVVGGLLGGAIGGMMGGLLGESVGAGMATFFNRDKEADSALSDQLTQAGIARQTPPVEQSVDMSDHSHTEVTVLTQPGMDEEQVGKQVRRQLAAAKRQQQQDNRAALYDAFEA